MKIRFFIPILVIIYILKFTSAAVASSKDSEMVSVQAKNRAMLIDQELNRFDRKSSSLQDAKDVKFSPEAQRVFQKQKGAGQGWLSKRFSGYADNIILTSADGSSERRMKPLSMDIGIEYHNYDYKEPKVSVKLNGDHLSIGGIATYRAVLDGEVMDYGKVRSSMNSVTSLDVRIFNGAVDYQGSGSYENIDDYGYEARVLTGVEWLSPDYLVNPYFGIGLRKLYNEFGAIPAQTINGQPYASGYDRDSKYLYAPVGVTVTKYFKSKWAVSVTAEYDHLLKGEQISHLSQSTDLSGANVGLMDAKNKQNKGYGLRLAVRLARDFGRYDLYCEPFIRYWNIKDSDEVLVYDLGGGVGLFGMEPKNTTKEIGVKMGINF